MATQTQTAPSDAGGTSLKGVGTTNVPEGASMPCPDPSAHQTKNTTLQDQASAAALYSTNLSRTSTRDPLGPDGKLSSVSAAASLKTAQAHELPSFPVVGIDTSTSAGTAATLANANFKSPEYPKAQRSAAAGKAALLAHDYKMAPLWQPEASAAGSKAALLAHKDGVKTNLWQPEPHAFGNSAATIAMGKKGLSPNADWTSTEEGKKRALVAATGAVRESGRKRAISTPVPPPIYPDSQNSARNALSAATIAHGPSLRAANSARTTSRDTNRLGSEAMEAARIQHSKVSREMYTAAPPVSLEVEEKKRQDALRASAISMAKKMYDVQQHHIDQATGRPPRSHAQTGAATAHNMQPETSSGDIKQQAMRYIHIQEAAQRLAAERLAKIGVDDAAQYRSYYGYEKPTRAKLSIRKGRNRAYSNPETGDSDDDMQSRRIRSQMSQLNQSLAQVDAQKREQDRKYLVAAAERKVQAQMLGLDKKIFDETGQMSPAMIEEWDAKARARAAANSEARMENHGKVHIGHGKFMDQSEIDAIAQARTQPTLDEIHEKTEKRKAEEEEMRLDMEEKRRQAQIEKERAGELKAEEKRAKAEEKKALKSKSAEERAAAKQEREAEKEKKAEEKRLAKESKRKSREGGEAATVTSPTTEGALEGRTEPVTGDAPADNVDPTTEQGAAHDPTSPTSPTKGLKGLLNKFKRRPKHSGASSEAEKETGFVGGASVRDAESRSHSPAPNRVILDRRPSEVSSLSDGSVRGRSIERPATSQSEVSELSEYEEARDGFNENMPPLPNFAASDAMSRATYSPSRDSRFREVGL